MDRENHSGKQYVNFERAEKGMENYCFKWMSNDKMVQRFENLKLNGLHLPLQTLGLSTNLFNEY